MKISITFYLLLIALPVIAGTFRDDFEDGNVNGWKMLPGEERFSIVDGILRMDNFNTPEFETDLYIMEPH